MSLINVNAIEPSTGTDITLGASGDTITIPSGATFTQSGTMNASAITAGTVATARLGTGTASSTTVLYGDQTYKAEPTGGKIGQVVNATLSSEVSSSTTVFADTGLTVDITPTATSSKVLVIVCASETRKKDHASARLQSKLLRDTTELVIMTNEAGFTNDIDQNNFGGTSATYLDSPSSTSALTYKVTFANGAGSDGSVTFCNSTSVSTITVMEVLA